MTQVKMPEPLRLRWNKYTGRYDISEDHRAAGDADLITTTQAEAYADARVREALEMAVNACKVYEALVEKNFAENNRVQHATGAVIGASACADRIRALLPPTE